jgi:uncharacterized cupin superfamily protein
MWMTEPSQGLKVGMWEAEANLGRWMNWPIHEFMITLQGEVVMVEEDRETVVNNGESFYPRGQLLHLEPGGFSEENHGTVRPTCRR